MTLDGDDCDIRTITVNRQGTALTVALELRDWSFVITEVLDEAGNPVNLTQAEIAWTHNQVLLGADETGR